MDTAGIVHLMNFMSESPKNYLSRLPRNLNHLRPGFEARWEIDLRELSQKLVAEVEDQFAHLSGTSSAQAQLKQKWLMVVKHLKNERLHSAEPNFWSPKMLLGALSFSNTEPLFTSKLRKIQISKEHQTQEFSLSSPRLSQALAGLTLVQRRLLESKLVLILKRLFSLKV